MRKVFYCLILYVLLASSCATNSPYVGNPRATHGPFYVGNPYDASVPYGEKRHPGIDFDINRGTPVIAASDGEVIYIGDPCPGQRHCGGIFVTLQHGDHMRSLYGHLGKVSVKNGQLLKRGQLIGLSGESNSGYVHLHFGICKTEGSCINYSQTYDPEGFWLGGKPQCFDPKRDYSNSSQKEITIPVACEEYAKELISRTKRKE
jgi:murein DD-endopeptidase MepM/ murein hydrolase activator NlpD